MDLEQEKEFRFKLLKKLRACFIYDPNHSLKLTSGRDSNFFIDCRKVTLDPEGAFLVARLILESVSLEQPDAIGGLTLGADPIVASIAILTMKDPNPIPAFIIRKDPKPFTRTGDPSSFIEGNLQRGSSVVLVDDVLTGGKGLERAVKILEEIDCNIIKIITLVDRMEGARETLETKGYQVESLFTVKDLLQT